MLLWPDGDINSDYSKKLVNAKAINDGNFWNVLREVLAYDFQTNDLDRCKVWASTSTVPLLSSNNKFAEIFHACLNTLTSEHAEAYHNAMSEPMVGCNLEDFNRFFRLFSDRNYSMNRMQLLYHLLISGWNVDTLKDISSIVEIGAGMGELTDITYKLGFDGKYSIFDFPELLNLQQYIHKKVGLNNVEYISEFEKFPVADLGIATFSFTEMPIDQRDRIIDTMAKTKNWIIAYSNFIFGLDNDAYIKNVFTEKFQNHDISFIDIPFMPWDGGSKYLVIKSK
jgi:hypothetical protein